MGRYIISNTAVLLQSLFPENNQTILHSEKWRISNSLMNHEPQWTKSTLRKVIHNSGFAWFCHFLPVKNDCCLHFRRPFWACVAFAFLISQRKAQVSLLACKRRSPNNQQRVTKFQGKGLGELPIWRTFYIGVNSHRGWSLGEGCLFARQHALRNSATNFWTKLDLAYLAWFCS
jgi:hypothetical protein